MNWNKIGYLADKFAGMDASMVAGRYTHMGFWHEPNLSTSRIRWRAWRTTTRLSDHIVGTADGGTDRANICREYEIDGLILQARALAALSPTPNS